MGFDKDKFLSYRRQVRKGCENWLGRMHCRGKPMGYYRFNEHAYHPWALYASIGAFAVYRALGIVDNLTEKQRSEWARLFLDNYHEDIGLFLCPQLYGTEFRGDPGKYEDRVKADSSAPFKKVALILLDLGKKIPAMPDEGTLELSSVGGLEQFLNKKREEQNPYAFGSIIGEFAWRRTLWLQSQKKSIEGDPWMKWLYEYIEHIRDPVTGLVTSNTDNRMLQMDGLFKLSFAPFWLRQRPMPHARKVIDAILTIQDPKGGFGEACEDYNATLLLCKLCIQEKGYGYDKILTVVTGPVLHRMEKRRKPDGGFSMHTDHCLTNVNAYPTSDLLPESDVMGTGQQLAVLDEIEKLLKFKGDLIA